MPKSKFWLLGLSLQLLAIVLAIGLQLIGVGHIITFWAYVVGVIAGFGSAFVLVPLFIKEEVRVAKRNRDMD